MKLIIAGVIMCALCGCAQQLPESTYNVPREPNYETISALYFNDVRKVVDNESGVVCYVVESRYSSASAGISCLAEYKEPQH